MTKPNIYIPQKEYFLSDLFDYINDDIKESAIPMFARIIKSSKRYLQTQDKKKYLLNEAKNISDKIDIDLFELVDFNFKLNITEDTCFVTESSLMSIIDNYRRFYKGNEITVVQLDVIGVCYALDDYNQIVIEDYQNYINKFYELKVTRQKNIINDIVLYILFISLIDYCENLIVEEKKTIPINSNILQWYGTQSELIELTKALIVNGTLKGGQEDIFKSMEKTFNIELKNVGQAITKFNIRNVGNETKFLDKLKSALYNFISTRLEKNR